MTDADKLIAALQHQVATLEQELRETAGELANTKEALRLLASRAPAQPAAPKPAAPRLLCSTHDAPLANEAFFKCGCRYLSPPSVPPAEAQLAAVRDILRKSCISDARCDDAGRLARAIRALLTPAPSPGAGEVTER